MFYWEKAPIQQHLLIKRRFEYFPNFSSTAIFFVVLFTLPNATVSVWSANIVSIIVKATNKTQQKSRISSKPQNSWITMQLNLKTPGRTVSLWVGGSVKRINVFEGGRPRAFSPALDIWGWRRRAIQALFAHGVKFI